MEETTVVSVITGALDGLETQLLLVASAALVVGVIVLALNRGWGFAKKFSK